MKFKELTAEQIEFAKKTYTNKELPWDDRMQELMHYFNKSERTVRKWAVKLGFKEKMDIEPDVLVKAKKKEHDKNKKRFLITSAQNATPVNKDFFDNLKVYADHIGAQILVIPYRYKNPTSMWSEKAQKDDWWDKEVIPYLTLNRHNLNNSIAILSDVKMQPTASMPLTSLETMTGEHSCVIGHPRVHLRSHPVLEGSKPKLMFTTGACTKPNYTNSKAGKIGEFHHTYGACIVEIKDEEVFFARQITANNKGEFIDLFYKVSNEKVTRVDKVEALIMGDIHVAVVDKDVVDVTLNDLCKKLHPSKLFLHDIIDSRSISHHDIDDPFLLYEKEMDGSNSLENEVKEMLKWLEQVEKYNVVIVKSNHDEHLDKFLRITDWRKMSTMKNALPYMKYSTAILEGKAPNGVVPYIINERYPNMKCLGINDSYKVRNIECGSHGHVGASGSRGSANQFKKLTKMVTGHTHQPCRIDGFSSVGTSTKLRLSYNRGASAWFHGHVLINLLGKTQHVLFVTTKDGVEYTTLNTDIDIMSM
jgi:hypothetical protein